jgi:osmoprotectant transport system substrate-binding protein
VLPEYSGTLLTFFDKNAKVTQPDEVYAALQKAMPQGLTVLDKSAAEDKDSIAVTKETADAWSLKAIPDLTAHQAELTLGAPAEFKTRQRGLVGLKSVYNVVPKEFRPLQSQAAVEALKNGQVKAANIFSTDPSIAADGFVVLDDPQSLFGSDNVVPLVRQEKADSLKAALNPVAAKLDTTALADMVKQVVVDKKDAAEVAKAWLSSAGLS